MRPSSLRDWKQRVATEIHTRVIILDFVADSPSRDLQQHRRSPQVQACRRAYHYHLATVHRKLQRTQLQDPLK